MASGEKRSMRQEQFLRLNTQGENSDYEVLVFVLRLLNPTADVEALASVLLDKYQRFSDVLDTPAELLAETPGIDVHTASALASYPDIFRCYTESKNLARTRVLNTKIAYHLVQSKFYGRKSEIMVLMILDSKGYLRNMSVISEGTVRSVPLYIREIMRLCLLYQADTVYIAHNHPSGNCTPSEQDIMATKEIDLALSVIDVILCDHFIFSDDDFLSMRAAGVLRGIRQDVAAFRKQVVKNQ